MPRARARHLQAVALGASLGAACVNPDAPAPATAVEPARSAPLIGRLENRDGIVDLTVDSFTDGAGSVPTSAYARIVADIAPQMQDAERDRDETSTTPIRK